MEVVISRSTKPDKRFKADFQTKTVHFGAKGGKTYVDHKDDRTKANWMARHKVRENWDRNESAGALSKHILWNKTNIQDSVKSLNRQQSQYKFRLK